MKTRPSPHQATLPGLAPPLPPALAWHASHDLAADPAAGLPARERCRACGVAGDGEAAAILGPLPCVGDPWGSLAEARALAAEEAEGLAVVAVDVPRGGVTLALATVERASVFSEAATLADVSHVALGIWPAARVPSARCTGTASRRRRA
jgi:hypothetical protein